MSDAAEALPALSRGISLMHVVHYPKGRQEARTAGRDLDLIASRVSPMQTQPSFSPYTPVSRQRVGQALDELSERARRINLSLHYLARSAGVTPSMLSQWRHGAAAATGRTFEHHLTRITRQLEIEEEALWQYLKSRPRRRA